MGPFIRIALRYGVGAVIGYEFGDQLASDPDVVMAIGVVMAALAGLATEAFYLLARRLGWRT